MTTHKTRNDLVGRSYRIYAYTAVCLFCCISLSGTSIVVVTSPISIALGADSKKFYRDRLIQTCKVFGNGVIFYAVAGVTDDVRVGFDANAIARNVSERSISVSIAAKRFGIAASGPLQASLKRIRRDYPRIYKIAVTPSPHALEAVFVQFSGGIPKFSILTVSIVDDSGDNMRLSVRQENCPGKACNYKDGIAFLGERADAEKLDRSGWVGPRDPASIAHILIQAEIKGDPHSVGPPVSVLVMDASGHHWTERGKCEDNAKYEGQR